MASFAYVQARGGVIARRIDDSPHPTPAGEEPEVVIDHWWFDSSFDLKQGLVVREVAPEVLPAELFESLFQPRRARFSTAHDIDRPKTDRGASDLS